ncbi:MAG: hypothetical protein LUH04_12000, partial [Clostridium sp.]|nr:hypothetical protein [Clostridium sp.]
MKEHIEDIAKDIKKHRYFEIHPPTTNPAFARIKATLEGKEKLFWILNKPRGREERTDFNRNVIPEAGIPIDRPYEEKEGIEMAIYKNLKLGELLITHYEGRHLY